MFENQELICRKKTGGAIRGVCVSESERGVVLRLSDKQVFLPYSEISEIIHFNSSDDFDSSSSEEDDSQ